MSCGVTVRVQVPLSAAGGSGAAATLAVTTSETVLPATSVARAVKVWTPGESQVVIRKPRLVPLSSPPKTYGAACSVQISLPSIRKSTSATGAPAGWGVAIQRVRSGMVVSPSRVDVTFCSVSGCVMLDDDSLDVVPPHPDVTSASSTATAAVPAAFNQVRLRCREAFAKSRRALPSRWGAHESV